ncbi:unnamed protein product [Arabis nemorensis]|uniref:Uncharacterized protein n=1 Tax=Arabis nemorensis TaxID=586526 RepID=A0A565C1J7_9BRAS|nr:unnamed protein product [Arabis nemorensis]
MSVEISDLDRDLGPGWLEASFQLWSVVWASPNATGEDPGVLVPDLSEEFP